MSNSNPYSGLTLTFVDDPFSGRVDDGFNTTVYRLQLKEGALGGKKASYVYRLAEKGSFDPVAEIDWGGFTRSKSVNIGGKNVGKLLDHRRTGLFSPPEYWFTAPDGKEYYWRKKDCYAASGEVVATYTRRVVRLFHSNTPAQLSVSQYFSSPPMLDFMVVSALMMEKRRQEEESRRRSAAAAGGASAGGGGGGGGC